MLLHLGFLSKSDCQNLTAESWKSPSLKRNQSLYQTIIWRFEVWYTQLALWVLFEVVVVQGFGTQVFFWLPQCFVIKIVAKSVASHVWHSWKGKQIKTNTPPKFNINPEQLPSQRESSLTTFFPFFPHKQRQECGLIPSLQDVDKMQSAKSDAAAWQWSIAPPRQQEATRDTVYLYIIVHCTYYVFFCQREDCVSAAHEARLMLLCLQCYARTSPGCIHGIAVPWPPGSSSIFEIQF